MTDLLTLGADVDWPDSEASTAVRDRLVSEPGLGRLAGLAEWVVGVRPAGSDLGRVRVAVIGAPVDDLVAGTAATTGAEVRSVAAGDIAAGAAVADEEIEGGTELLVVAVPGLRSDAAIAVSVLTNTEPVKVLSRGTAATDPTAWMDLAVDVRDGRRRCLAARDDADRLLTELGSARLATAAGLVLQAAVRRTPVLLDGPVAAAAALIAYEAQPRAVRWWAAADQGDDPLHELALTRLGQRPILGLGTGLGDGLAGVLALGAVRTALRLAEAAGRD